MWKVSIQNFNNFPFTVDTPGINIETGFLGRKPFLGASKIQLMPYDVNHICAVISIHSGKIAIEANGVGVLYK
ncbi:MAG: hypothetical protein ACI92E_000339 [Oceanicoccus sp.]|jgi:hypothetical protein